MSNPGQPMKGRWHKLKLACALIGFGMFGPFALGQVLWMLMSGEIYQRSRVLASAVEQPIRFYALITVFGAGALLLTAVSLTIVIAFIRARWQK